MLNLIETVTKAATEAAETALDDACTDVLGGEDDNDELVSRFLTELASAIKTRFAENLQSELDDAFQA